MARRARATENRRQAAPTPVSGGRLVVRHYCPGFGDCHLVALPKRGGGVAYMLIDCGSHPRLKTAEAEVDAIVADLKAVTGGRIDVLVISHEHMDHLLAFDPSDNRFVGFAIEEVWFAWTEDPDDPLARELDLWKQQGAAALEMMSERLAGLHMDDPMLSLGEALAGMRGFYAKEPGKTIRPYREAARALAKRQVRHLKPGDAPEIPGLDGVRFYVLGPPRDRAALRVEERSGELYRFGAGATPGLAGLAIGAMYASAGDVLADAGAPFDPEIGVPLRQALDSAGRLADRPPPTRRSGPEAGRSDALVSLLARHYLADDGTPGTPEARAARARRRRIDGDWLGISADLALQLDTGINNTSLVLAIEFGPERRVALFPGDAQVGNWLSWPSVTFGTGEDRIDGAGVMERTVYLKVAHHGSHNGTLKQNGLERMTHADLSAFVPVRAEAAAALNWKKIPFDPLLDALRASTSGRVIRADDGWIASGVAPAGRIPGGSVRSARGGGNGLFVDVEIG